MLGFKYPNTRINIAPLLNIWFYCVKDVGAAGWILTKFPRCDRINLYSLNEANQGSW